MQSPRLAPSISEPPVPRIKDEMGQLTTAVDEMVKHIAELSERLAWVRSPCPDNVLETMVSNKEPPSSELVEQICVLRDKVEAQNRLLYKLLQELEV